eukprot:TRINITY_DN5457_c0_g7_i1.p1 TRINITY_DN5457_c0_g7~~TRINITY_DN5457_c0_g7_i1.p1  ORF type:complete len:374 (+),score=58.02 TRINITY_DN5457_c0_g7_i1:76-1197(+)
MSSCVVSGAAAAVLSEADADDAWGAEAVAAAAAGRGPAPPGLPQGLRVRGSLRQAAEHVMKSREPASMGPATEEQAKRRREADRPASTGFAKLPDRLEVVLLGAFFLFCLLATLHLFFQATAATQPLAPLKDGWQLSCRQCKREWWEEFWRWRLQAVQDGSAPTELHTAPPGLEWEWGSSYNDTDWYQASPQLVREVVQVHVNPRTGPVLHIGCGASPLPDLLYSAGFRDSEHVDIAPDVIATLQQRYQAETWPGMRFEVRDFLASGAPPPTNRFAAVIDKAGIWDWLQEEAADALPRLLSAVRDALLPTGGVYIVATKQKPKELAQTLALLAVDAAPGSAFASGSPGLFHVEATQPLGDAGVAWAYVLAPAA